MIRHPPRSTLFPYTPLSRSLERRVVAESPCPKGKQRRQAQLGPKRNWLDLVADRRFEARRARGEVLRHARQFRFGPRSEEHTSELQSQSNLVCRLLLEKKKK